MHSILSYPPLCSLVYFALIHARTSLSPFLEILLQTKIFQRLTALISSSFMFTNNGDIKLNFGKRTRKQRLRKLRSGKCERRREQAE